MKYGSYTIVSLLDFRRYFSWRNFFANREQFVRDMNPAKVFYWNNELKMAYKHICDWIMNKRTLSKNDISSDILSAFTILLGYEPEIAAYADQKQYDFSQPVIILNSNEDIVLPTSEIEFFANSKISLRLHKIKNSEGSVGNSSVSLGGNSVCEIESGDVVYVTEINGKFIDFLKSHAENQIFSAQLIDEPNSIGSILVITDKRTGVKQQIPHVVSFVLVDKGYIYVTDTGNLVSIENDLPIFLLKEPDTKALQVKIIGDIVKVLYENGVCRSTDSLQPTQGIIKLIN